MKLATQISAPTRSAPAEPGDLSLCVTDTRNGGDGKRGRRDVRHRVGEGASLGIAQMPDFLAADGLAKGEFVPLLDDHALTETFWLVWPQQIHHAPQSCGPSSTSASGAFCLGESAGGSESSAPSGMATRGWGRPLPASAPPWTGAENHQPAHEKRLRHWTSRLGEIPMDFGGSYPIGM